MIPFTCKYCSFLIKSPDEFAGRKVKCPKCNEVNRIPDPNAKPLASAEPEKPRPKQAFEDSMAPQIVDGLIKFRCPNCAKKIGLEQKYAGKNVRCGKCKFPLVVPGEPVPERSTPKQPPPSPQNTEPDFPEQNLDGLEELLAAEQNADSEIRVMKDPKPEPKLNHETTSNGALIPNVDILQEGITLLDQSEPESYSSNYAKKFGIAVGAFCTLLLLLPIAFHLYCRMSSIGDVFRDVPDSMASVADEYVNYLISGDLKKIKSMHSSNLSEQVSDTNLSLFVDSIPHNDTNPRRIQSVVRTDGENDRYVIRYLVNTNQSILVELYDFDGDLAVSSVAIRNSSIGPQNYNQLFRAVRSREGLDVFVITPCMAMPIRLLLAFILISSWWYIFEKADEPGWAILIPMYNLWVMAKVADKPGWLGLGAASGILGVILSPIIGLAFASAALMPMIVLGGWIVSIICYFIICLGIAKVFERKILLGIGIALFPTFFVPYLAFSLE